ncbi:MAG: HlyD family secretion protein [Planctomycetota bacterium]|nr:HlyD family secretion protein [Planctomycetota bacterium]
MFRKILLPLLAVLGVAFAVFTVVKGNRPTPVAQPAAQPSQAPYPYYIAGAGIVEALSENIAVGTVVPGIVKEIYVKVGDNVAAGQPLWLIDDRDLQADLEVKRAEVEAKQATVLSKQALLEAAQSKYDRLKQMPRPEEVPASQARADADLHSLQDAQDQLKTVQSVSDPRAVSQDDMDRRRHAVEIAQAKYAESQANLALLKAGSWDQDLKVASADIQSAKSDIVSAQADLKQAQAQVQGDLDLIKRFTVTAPVGGQVMQVKLHLGEYAPLGVLATPLMLIGDLHKLVVRTDVDENDAWRVPRGSSGDFHAIAFLRGNRDIKCDLAFYRVEPYVIPKKSLTGDSTERVDTRVLQVLYSFDVGDKPIYVGQQMDVFIETAAPATAPSVAVAAPQ